jgi:2-dehydro-3-deoxyglucarate aldolase/4-hydroxy-2-oxoheptanedioate aldolase
LIAPRVGKKISNTDEVSDMAARLKELLKQDRLLRVCVLGQLCDPKLIELIAIQGGYDAVWLDQEHAGLSNRQLEEATRAARASGMDSFVRLYATDYATVMRPLEAGAGGIMAAQVRSAQQTKEIVDWSKFHPRGMRGVNSTGVDGRYGTVPLADYLRQSNAKTFIAIQIENVQALEEVEAIAATPDVDLLFVGPADLSQSMGLPAEWDHPRHWQAIERIARAAQKHGTHWAILPPAVSYARRCVELGCKMLSLGIDVWFMKRGLQAFQDEYGEFFAK